MRWDALRLDDGGEDTLAAAGVLPLIERRAVTRTFDTPGFRGMTFYEVQARSIVNRVPESSQMMFKWTINPYRGCQHACTYCVVGETPILMADGRAKPIADLRVGDEIYGTVRDGYYRRYTTTTVQAHWSTVKPAYRVVLADGTTLITSGDHRFLTERGWKHVTGAEHGPLQRPFLTVNSKLTGFGGFAEPPKENADYRRGYLCGVIRGDGPVGHYTYPEGDAGDSVHRFRLALTDVEGLTRTSAYLSRLGIDCGEFTFAERTSKRRPVMAIRTSRRDEVRAIEHAIRWPDDPGPDWRKGFLAGIFDAAGSYSRGVWRVPNADPEIIDQTAASLRAFGFDYAAGPTKNANGLVVLRMRGGLKEAMRFFQTTDPAITRKRSIDGAAVKSDARLQVEAIEPLGLDLPMFDITTGTGDFIANGVVSHNCFARNTHTYLDMDAGSDFNTRVVVKVNAPELLRRKLASPRWQGEHIAMGTNVDCYQRAEGRYRLMPGIISALRDAANPFSILTKGTLILRDIDLLASAAQVTEVGLNVSCGFTDTELWRSVEPGTPAPERRLEVCATLNDRGLACGVLMGPVIPYLTDSPAQLEETVRQIAATGAVHVTPIVLHLRPGAREWYLRWLRWAHPELVGRYEEFYGRGSYAPRDYQERIAGQVRELAASYGIGKRRGKGRSRGIGRGPGRSMRTQQGTELEVPPPPPRGERPNEQLTLL
jgi:DNA repair photolyase